MVNKQLLWSKVFTSFLVSCIFSASLYTNSQVQAITREFKWESKYEYKSPDCFNKLVITINGESPGPTIFAQQGNKIVVELTNSLLTENIAIHWHGIRQIGTPWSDGTEGVTQCPILPGETFRYDFYVDRAGTYLYHGHYGMLRNDGLYGSIIVSEPQNVSEPFSYDEDHSIILNDWYHNSTQVLGTGLSSKAFVWVGEPQSLLIHGRGRFNCSLLGIPSSGSSVCNASSSDCSPYVLSVMSGKTYRLRISSLTSLSALSFEIEGHNMTIVEADGHYIDPLEVKNLFIYSGETYSILVKANQDPSRNYWITTNVVSRKPSTPTGLAIFNYSPNQPQPSPPPTSPTLGPFWNDRAPRLAQSLALKPHKEHVQPPPTTSDRTIVLLNTQNKIDDHVRWSVNNVSFTHPDTPYLIALKNNMTDVFDQNPPPDSYDYVNYDIFIEQNNKNASYGDSVFKLEFNATIDVVLQNANTMRANTSETHPWHLHGHDFWVLGYGVGKFDAIEGPKGYNVVNPVMKNTVPVHPYGWTAVRFVANNPGAWSFHCHIESHLFLGMKVVFAEGIERVGDLPAAIMGCGKAKGLRRL